MTGHWSAFFLLQAVYTFASRADAIPGGDLSKDLYSTESNDK